MYRGTRVLAVLGTVLAWFPLAATVLISLAGSLVRGAFLFDYLMPAEFFPVALVGGGLLLWAAVRARLRRRWIAWSLGLAVALLHLEHEPQPEIERDIVRVALEGSAKHLGGMVHVAAAQMDLGQSGRTTQVVRV